MSKIFDYLHRFFSDFKQILFISFKIFQKYLFYYSLLKFCANNSKRYFNNSKKIHKIDLKYSLKLRKKIHQCFSNLSKISSNFQ